MKKYLLLTVSLLMTVVMLADQLISQSGGNRLLKPGDEVAGMIITKGIADAPPLWAFCSPAGEDDHSTSVDCRVPAVTKLAIGHTLGLVDPVLQTLDWSTLNWKLSIDGHAVDLNAFGTYDYVRPDLAPSPSPIREIFRQSKAWDVILIHPTAGAHTLLGMAQDESQTYTWTVNFTVQESPSP